MPIGFLSDHMEVIYDLDVEARRLAGELGIRMARARTVETHPAMIEMIAELVERETGAVRRDVLRGVLRRPAAKSTWLRNNSAIQIALGNAASLGHALDGVHAGQALQLQRADLVFRRRLIGAASRRLDAARSAE